MQHDTYVISTLSICTRYYYDVFVIYTSSSNGMLSSLSYETYKYNMNPRKENIDHTRGILRIRDMKRRQRAPSYDTRMSRH